MPKRFTILSVVLFTSLGSISYAQNFPVRVTPILTPPYTPFLTDYTDAGSEKLTVQILLNDVTVPEYRCKLRLTIEGVNISITTNPNYVPLPIVLSGGVPQIVYGSDLSEYFKPSNLVFQGINQNDFERKGSQLPEGIYRISIEVLDYNRSTVVSNKGSATAWMILNDPPFINMPVNNSKLRPLNPQNIVFQWTPRHRGSPNAAFTTEYEVKMVEIWPAGRNPYDAINTSRPIFETTVDNTLVVYGPAETPLVLGREYALQVRARDTGGKDLFKNNGYSEVIRFVYGDECPLPSGLFADDLGTMKARMRWQGNGQNTGYILRFREKKQGAQWFEERTNQTFVNSTAMRAGATYEYQVCGECEGFRSEYTKEQTFTTLTENPNAFVCGGPSAVPPPDGSAPLPALFINDFIKAGGFDVVVTKATGSNGRFSGEGLAVIPWFNSAKVRMTFKDISVNKSYQLTAGEIISVWDANSKSLRVEDKTLAEGGGKGLEGLATVEADTLIQLTGSIITVFINTDGNIVAQTNQGDVVIPAEKGKSYAIADQLGNGYIVDKDGKITKTTANEVANAAARGQREYSKDPNLSVRFAKAEGIGTATNYGFDEQREGTLQENYQQTENGKWIAWKALPSGKTDIVAVAPEGTTDLSKVKFKVEGINPLPIAIGTNTQALTLTGSTHGTTEEILAYYPQQDTSKDDVVVGKLNVVSYNPIQKNLVLIKVNQALFSSSTEMVKSRLNGIFQQGVMSWSNVKIEELNVSGINAATLDDGESGLVSNYTKEMREVINAYTVKSSLASDTYYLFLVEGAKNPDKLGYMPRKKQAGFIFIKPHRSEEELLQTMAHELAHGAFRLAHTFSEYPSLSQGSTDNLMDYNRGLRLNKYQWDYIHNPEAVLGLFEDDEDGAMVATLNTAIDVDEQSFDDILSDASQADIAYMEKTYWRLRKENGDKNDFTGFEWTASRLAYFRGRQDLWNIFRVTAKEQGYLEDTKTDFADFLIEISPDIEKLSDEEIYLLVQARHKAYLEIKGAYLLQIESTAITIASIYYPVVNEAMQRLKGNPAMMTRVGRLESKLITASQTEAGKLAYLANVAGKNGIKNLAWTFKEILEFSKGRTDLARNLILATQEITEGKSLAELAQFLKLSETPALGSLSLYQARVWYSWQKALISSKVNYSKGLENAAKEAVEMRNSIRTTARQLMKDTDWAAALQEGEVNLSWQDVYNKYSKTHSGDALWNEIIQASMRGREKVDLFFKFSN